jgi:hypothetical protein
LTKATKKVAVKWKRTGTTIAKGQNAIFSALVAKLSNSAIYNIDELNYNNGSTLNLTSEFQQMFTRGD